MPLDSGPARLVVSDLHRVFPGRPPVTALAGVSVSVEPGELMAVLGPSGCGKTTLLRSVAGMERPDQGTIELGDRLLDGPDCHLPPERRAVGLVPQEGALFPHLDVARNVAFGLRGLDRAQRAARVTELLDLVHLPGLGRRRPHQLSGGQQQRVALARALAPQPDLVLLDEPFSALDTGLRASVRAEVAATLRAAGSTSVLVTHDQVEALTMADTVAVMREGRIVQVGRPDDVYHRPADAWTAAFLGEAVMVSGERDGDRHVLTPLGRLLLDPAFTHSDQPRPRVFLRPEQVGPAAEARGGVPATVTEVTFLGPDTLVSLTVGPGDADTDVCLRARWASTSHPSVGDRVAVAVTGTVLAYPAASTAAASSSGVMAESSDTRL